MALENNKIYRSVLGSLLFYYKYFNLNEDEIKELKKFNVYNADKL